MQYWLAGKYPIPGTFGETVSRCVEIDDQFAFIPSGLAATYFMPGNGEETTNWSHYALPLEDANVLGAACVGGPEAELTCKLLSHGAKLSIIPVSDHAPG